MPRSRRRIFTALAGLILLVGANEPSNNSTGNASTAQANQEAGQHENVAAGISRIGNAFETQNGKTDPHEEKRNQREIRDLQAQESSAYWAAAMFWATATALVLSVIGIRLVWTTFRETRKANDIAAKFQRARLQPTFEIIPGNRFAERSVAISAKNIGGSAAIGAYLDFEAGNFVPDKMGNLSHRSHAHVIPPDQSCSFTIFAPDQRNLIEYYLYGTISYNCVFGEQHSAHFCVRIEDAEFHPAIANRAAVVATPCRPVTWPADT